MDKKLVNQKDFSNPMDCCSAPGWEELGRNRLDPVKRKVIDLRIHKTNTHPCKTMDGKLIDKIEETYPDFKKTADLRGDKVPYYSIFTYKQRALFELIHPFGKDYTLKEAAKELDVSIQAVRKMYSTMKRNCTEAFYYEKCLERAAGDGTKDIKQIYAGKQRMAKSKGLEFSISLEDMEEIIQQECYYCEELGTRTAVNNKSGNRFQYNYLWRYDVIKGYNYANLICICDSCAVKKRKGIL